MENIDKQEVKKFSDLAEEWWNEKGDFKPLHVINPLRANYIKEKTDLTDKSPINECTFFELNSFIISLIQIPLSNSLFLLLLY